MPFPKKKKVKKLKYFKEDVIAKIKIDTLKGYIVRPRLPSENLLTIRFPESWRREKVGVIIVSLFRGYFINWFKSQRKRVYNTLGQLGIEMFGLYLIPTSRIADYWALVEVWRAEYLQHITDMLEFLEGRITPHLQEKLDNNPRISLNEGYIKLIRKYLLENINETVSIKTRVKKIQELITNTFIQRVMPISASFSATQLIEAFDKETAEHLKRVTIEEEVKLKKQYEALRTKMKREVELEKQRIVRELLQKYENDLNRVIKLLLQIVTGKLNKEKLTYVKNLLDTLNHDVETTTNTSLPVFSTLSTYIDALITEDPEKLEKAKDIVLQDELLPPRVKSLLSTKFKNVISPDVWDYIKAKRREQRKKKVKRYGA